jgi:3-oxoacyl-[acyl-carrier-protein] synthase II
MPCWCWEKDCQALKITIKGIGAVGGFGTGIAALQQSLTTGHTRIQSVPLDTSEGPIRIPALLADTTAIRSYVGKRELRRIDHYIRMALLGSFLALDDADLLESKPDRMGIIVATGYGATCNTFDFQHSVITAGDPCGSPTKFSNSVHNAAAAHISIILKELGPNLSISHYDMSMPSALLSAIQWLQEDRVQWVLVGGVDEFCKVLGYYWHCRCGNSDFPPETAGQSADGHALVGEGACFFVLKNENEATSAYGTIEDVQLGSLSHGGIELPDKSPVVLGADDFGNGDSRYAELLPGECRAAIYTPLYGALPVGMAFDMAIAALSFQSGRLFPSTHTDLPGMSDLRFVRSDEPLAGRCVSCLKLGAGNAFGRVTLHRN